MLSRSAEDLYWMARYMERAENAARVLDVSNRMSAVPTGDDSEAMHWRPALQIGPDPAAFDGAYGETTRANVITFMALDRDNPSSIWSCVQAARENARAERSAIAAAESTGVIRRLCPPAAVASSASQSSAGLCPIATV